MGMVFIDSLKNLLVLVLSSVLLIIVGVLYFMLTVWIIKMGAAWAGYQTVEGSTVVLTAGIVTAAAMVGSALQR